MPRYSDDSAFEDGQLVELAKTKLRINNDELQRLNAEGHFLLHLPLEDVEKIAIRRKLDADGGGIAPSPASESR